MPAFCLFDKEAMDKKNLIRKVTRLLLLGFLAGMVTGTFMTIAWHAGHVDMLQAAQTLLSREPAQVRALRARKVEEKEEGRLEYYFSQLTDREKRSYREMLESLRNREEEFYLTVSKEDEIDRVFHAVLNDHPELFWARNKQPVYRTLYSGQDYCLFKPGYAYGTEDGEEEKGGQLEEIQACINRAADEVENLVGEDAGDYEKAEVVYTYIIDHASYVESEDDQSIAGVFWKGEAVCAGYAAAVQYLLEKLGVFCIYVEGSSDGSELGHAWNIARLDGDYYYIDATNADQPDFLLGDAASLAEHKTILMDYLCPFPEEYEETYTPSETFEVPTCTATADNFYVRNNGCFDSYRAEDLDAYFHMRINNGAAVIRYKFVEEEAYQQAEEEWASSPELEDAIQYYMRRNGLDQVQYHYGSLESLKTVYYIF